MVRSAAKTVEEYLESLPTDRQEIIKQVRNVILANLPKGYMEIMQYGMISYVVPFSILPKTYKNQPLSYVALASQKNYISLYLMGVYGDPATEKRFQEQFEAAGKKLNMGKSCVRFKKIEELPLDVIGNTIAQVPVELFITRYKAIKGDK